MFAEFDLILCMIHNAHGHITIGKRCSRHAGYSLAVDIFYILSVPEHDGKLYEQSWQVSNMENAQQENKILYLLQAEFTFSKYVFWVVIT